MYSVTGNRNQNKETFLSPITRHWTSIVYLKHREESASCHHACILSHIQHDPWLTVGIRELLGFHSVDPFETEPAEGSANVSTTLKQFDTPEKKRKKRKTLSFLEFLEESIWMTKKENNRSIVRSDCTLQMALLIAESAQHKTYSYIYTSTIAFLSASEGLNLKSVLKRHCTEQSLWRRKLCDSHGIKKKSKKSIMVFNKLAVFN